ncbi:MAG: hypothetical protein U0271_18355 [Polyangiaceae bacterium]
MFREAAREDVIVLTSRELGLLARLKRTLRSLARPTAVLFGLFAAPVLLLSLVLILAGVPLTFLLIGCGGTFGLFILSSLLSFARAFGQTSDASALLPRALSLHTDKIEVVPREGPTTAHRWSYIQAYSLQNDTIILVLTLEPRTEWILTRAAVGPALFDRIATLLEANRVPRL